MLTLSLLFLSMETCSIKNVIIFGKIYRLVQVSGDQYSPNRHSRHPRDSSISHYHLLFFGGQNSNWSCFD